MSSLARSPSLQGWALLALSALLLGCSGKPTGSSGTSGGGSLLELARLTEDDQGEVVAAHVYGPKIGNTEALQIEQFSGLKEVSFQECDIDDEGLAGLAKCAQVTSLKLINVPVSDDGLQHAGTLPLENVVLARTKVTGKGLTHLAGGQLSKLSLSARAATKEGMAAITELTTLRELELHCPELPIGDLPPLAKLESLRSLDLLKTPVDANGLEPLRGLAGLVDLKLDAADLGDAQVDVLNTLAGLESLELRAVGVSNEGLSKLSLPKLKRLSLDSCERVTDAGLSQLQGLPALEELDLSSSGVVGNDLTPLADLPKLKRVIVLAEQFTGGEQALKALRDLRPDVVVEILRG